MGKEPPYYKGYIAGYWDGVKDCASGKVLDGQATDLGKLPIRAMGLPTRICNCLLFRGYNCVEDLLSLSEGDIMRMRNVGQKTASEIAHWMVEHGILGSAWSAFL